MPVHTVNNPETFAHALNIFRPNDTIVLENDIELDGGEYILDCDVYIHSFLGASFVLNFDSAVIIGHNHELSVNRSVSLLLRNCIVNDIILPQRWFGGNNTFTNVSFDNSTPNITSIPSTTQFNSGPLDPLQSSRTAFDIPVGTYAVNETIPISDNVTYAIPQTGRQAGTVRAPRWEEQDGERPRVRLSGGHFTYIRPNNLPPVYKERIDKLREELKREKD